MTEELIHGWCFNLIELKFKNNIYTTDIEQCSPISVLDGGVLALYRFAGLCCTTEGAQICASMSLAKWG